MITWQCTLAGDGQRLDFGLTNDGHAAQAADVIRAFLGRMKVDHSAITDLPGYGATHIAGGEWLLELRGPVTGEKDWRNVNFNASQAVLYATHNWRVNHA